jgi:hypothetical protein
VEGNEPLPPPICHGLRRLAMTSACQAIYTDSQQLPQAQESSTPLERQVLCFFVPSEASFHVVGKGTTPRGGWDKQGRA